MEKDDPGSTEIKKYIFGNTKVTRAPGTRAESGVCGRPSLSPCGLPAHAGGNGAPGSAENTPLCVSERFHLLVSRTAAETLLFQGTELGPERPETDLRRGQRRT